MWLWAAVPLAAAGASTPCACPCDKPVAEAPGAADPFRLPTQDAYRLNREGRDLYRQRRWAEARVKYDQALTADPEFRGPLVNITSSLVQEGRFVEAVQSAERLLARAFVPGAREILEAADLAPLHNRPEMTTLRAAVARAGVAWGAGLSDALFFIARTRAPVRLPEDGVLVLRLHQEIFAYLPRTGRYRQVSAEEGGVLAVAVSPDRRHLAYVGGGKLVRSRGAPDVLRSLTVRVLHVPTMALMATARVDQDVTEVSVGWRGAYHVPRVSWRPARGQPVWHRLQGGALTPEPGQRPVAADVTLTAAGVVRAHRESGAPGCRYDARDALRSTPVVIVRHPSGRSWSLAGPHGAGLRGLPFPR